MRNHHWTVTLIALAGCVGIGAGACSSNEDAGAGAGAGAGGGGAGADAGADSGGGTGGGAAADGGADSGTDSEAEAGSDSASDSGAEAEADGGVESGTDGGGGAGGSGGGDGGSTSAWVKEMPAYAQSVALDSAGNVLLSGSLGKPVDFGGGTLTPSGVSYADIFLLKLDAAGNHVWSKGVGGAFDWDFVATDASNAVIAFGDYDKSVDFGGGPLPAAKSPSLYLAKLDAAGNHLWSKSFGAGTGWANAGRVAVDASGNIVLCGSTNGGTIDFGSGPLTSAGKDDVVVAKFDPAGNALWSKIFGDANRQYGATVAVDGAGNVLVGGTFEGTVDFGGGALTAGGATDYFVVKLDPGGNHVFSIQLGALGDSEVAADAAGNVVVAGDAIVELAPSGATIFTKQPGARSRAVAVDGAGRILLGGTFSPTEALDFGGGALVNAGSNDVFLAILDASGNHVASGAYGDASSQNLRDLTADAVGNRAVVGNYQGTIDFGSGALTASTSGVGYVAVLPR